MIHIYLLHHTIAKTKALYDFFHPTTLHLPLFLESDCMTSRPLGANITSFFIDSLCILYYPCLSVLPASVTNQQLVFLSKECSHWLLNPQTIWISLRNPLKLGPCAIKLSQENSGAPRTLICLLPGMQKLSKLLRQ